MELKANLFGFKELEQALKKMPEAIAKKALEAGVKGAANAMRKEIRQDAPVDSGSLKKNIQITKNKHDKTGVSFMVAPRRKVFYARMVEFGTSKMPAKPFIRPAFERSKEHIIQAMRRALEKSILKEAHKLAEQTQAKNPKRKA